MTADQLNARAQSMHQILRATLIGLIVLRISGLWILTPPATLAGALGLTALLVLFVWPVWTKSIKACLWLSFVSTLFFTIGVLNAMTAGRTAYGVVESLLAAAIFISAMLFGRYAYRTLEARQAETA